MRFFGNAFLQLCYLCLKVVNANEIDAELVDSINGTNVSDSEIFERNDLQIMQCDLDVDVVWNNDERDNVLPNLDYFEEKNYSDLEKNLHLGENDSEDESIFYDADKIFEITAENYSVENEVYFIL